MRELYWTIAANVRKSRRQCQVSISNRGKMARSVISVRDKNLLRQLKTGFALSNKDVHLLRWLGKHVEDQQAINILAAQKFMQPVYLYGDTDPQSIVTAFRQPRHFPSCASVLVARSVVDCVALSKNLVGDILCVTMGAFQFRDIKGDVNNVSGIGVFQVPSHKVISAAETKKVRSTP